MSWTVFFTSESEEMLLQIEDRRIRTGDPADDIEEHTGLFNGVIERYVRSQLERRRSAAP